jgi:hypothetical protein
MSLVNRTGEVGAPPCTGTPTVCVIPGLNIYTITYLGFPQSHSHKLWRDTQGVPHWIDITATTGAVTNASPFAFVNSRTTQEIVLWRGTTAPTAVFDSWHTWPTGDMGWENLSGTARAPRPVNVPVGYYDPKFDMHVVYYTDQNNLHIHVLFWEDGNNVSYDGDLTNKATPPAPRVAGNLSAFFNAHGDHMVVYKSNPDGHICFLGFRGPDPPTSHNLSDLAGTPLATWDIPPPAAYYLEQNDMHQIVYRARDDRHLYEIFWGRGAGVIGWDITRAAGAPLAAQAPLAYYHAATNTKHVIYINDERHTIDIAWAPGNTTPQFRDLTREFGLPHASPSMAAAFAIEGGRQHIVFVDSPPLPSQTHIFELIR